jgi:acetylornithine/N-succinyldiaminopimelate aminotransferase
MLTTADIAKMLPAGTHGTTFGGNPLACTVAAAVLEQVSSRALLANVKERGTQLQAGLSGLARQYGVFGEPRGMGLLLGVPLAEPWKGRAREAVDEILRDGLWLLVGGANVLRFAPPLNITAMDIDEGLIRLERTCIRLAEPRLV